MKDFILNALHKNKVISEAKDNGVLNTCEKCGICYVNYYNWLNKLEKGEELVLSCKKSKEYNDFYNLILENERLKKLIKEKDNTIIQLLNLNPDFSF
jgi:hypothetical protein